MSYSNPTIFYASGWALDRQYLKRRPVGKVWSTLLFLQEQPSAKQRTFKYGKVLFIYSPHGADPTIGWEDLSKKDKLWEWRYNLEGSQLYHLKGAGMDVYAPPPGTVEARQPNWWTRIDIDLPRHDVGSICTVKEIPGDEKAVLCYADGPQLTPIPRRSGRCFANGSANECGTTYSG
jgi:hypothetical protein